MTRRRDKLIQVGEDFRIAINLTIKNFLKTEDKKEYEFPSSLTSTERFYLHQYCGNLGLKSKSRGQGANRFLTVYKKEGSTIVQADAIFILGSSSRKQIANLLQKFSLTTRERQDLIPPAERDRFCGQEFARDLNRSLGRLGSSIPMIPPRTYENNYTAARQNLPIWNSQEEIIHMIMCHQVVLISGETGSGKTTQVPQFIMDQCCLTGAPCRIICTQPRRLAAISVSERVALERDDKIGQTVGYQVRLESKLGPRTILTFCTNGVLLRTLMGGDTSIATVTHIVVDELHERDRYCDFLLIVLRDLLIKYRGLKLVLMSASLDVQLFSKYFSNCPIIEVPGRTYDVKTFFLEDVLKGTGYSNKSMQQKFKDKKKVLRKKKVDSWCATKSSESEEKEPTEELKKEKDFLLDFSMESLSLNSPTRCMEQNIDPQLAATMDQTIENIWLNKSDDFTYLMHLLLTENVSVDYQHSQTNVSPLMLAAGRGAMDAVEQLLVLGASIHIKSSNDWTAIDWATNFNHKEVTELLTSQWDMDKATEESPAVETQVETTEEDKELLDAYAHSVDEDKIDYDLVICLLARICSSQEDGAVLIFLPGYDDIVNLRDRIASEPIHVPDTRTMLFALHSQMQSTDQKRVFKMAPHGVRKIILSTNIAETSITINDVVFVIDCGKVKEKSYCALTGVTQLKSGWISKASAIQRRGRAGRCRPGLCYHLYSRARFNSFPKFQVPEILRTPIHELCLQAKLLAPPNAPIADFLAKAADPPSFMVTRNAVTLLKTIDALDPWEELTELGLHLLDMPMEPRLGKMILYSVALKCLDPVLTIVCCLSYRDPFLIPSQPEQKRTLAMVKRKFADNTFSDHMVLLRAFQAWQKAKSEGNQRAFCSRNFLSNSTMEMILGIRMQILGQLRASGFVKPKGFGDLRDLNSNSENWPLIKASLLAGTHPNLIRIDRERNQLITQKECKVRFHHSSVLNKLPMSSKHSAPFLRKQLINELPSDWIFYEELMRTGTVAHAHTCTLVSPITVALFSGPAKLPLDSLHEPDQARLVGYMEEEDSEDDSKYDTHKSLFKIDDWISFRVDPDIARQGLSLRQKWQALFLKRMHNPSKPLTQSDENTIRTLANVLVAEDQDLDLKQPQGIGQRPRSIMMDYNSPTHMRKPSSPNRLAGMFQPGNSYSLSGFPNYQESQPHNYQESQPHNYQESQHYMSMGPPPVPSFNPSVGGCKVHRNQPPPPQLFNSNAHPPRNEHPTPNTSSKIKYFIIKASTSRLVELSMTKNIWAFTPTTERKILAAVKEGKEVVLIFSIQGSGHFQGFAHFTPQISPVCPPEFSSPYLGTCFKIQWIRKANIPFQSTRHLQNAWNENRRVQISRDGQELEPRVGESLCELIDKGHKVYAHDSIKARLPSTFSRESFHSEPQHQQFVRNNQMSSDQGQQITSWYNPMASGPKFWSQADS